MKYDVALVEDLGDKLKVKYIDTYQNSLLKSDGLYVKISNVAGDVIREAISEFKMVFLPKNINGELCISDVVIEDIDGFEKDKRIALVDIYNKMDYYQFNIGAIDFFNFLATYSKLAAEGYFIHEDNREEKYIEIIETDDEDLICVLDEYLELSDRIGKFSYLHRKNNRFEEKIINCKDNEELKMIMDEYIITI